MYKNSKYKRCLFEDSHVAESHGRQQQHALSHNALGSTSGDFWGSSGTRRWTGKAIVSDDLCQVLGRSLRDTSQLRVREIYVVDAKALHVTMFPFKVVHQGPGSVTQHRTVIQLYGCSTQRQYWVVNTRVNQVIDMSEP